MLHRDKKEFMFTHDHDGAIKLKRDSVIYLYRRDVVSVIFSFTSMSGITREENVVPYAKVYAKHLRKWLLDERFTKRKTVVCYEDMQRDATAQILRIGAHLGISISREHAEASARNASKERLVEVTSGWGDETRPVIRMSSDYEELRSRFRDEYGARIKEAFLSVEPTRLNDYVDWTNPEEGR